MAKQKFSIILSVEVETLPPEEKQVTEAAVKKQTKKLLQQTISSNYDYTIHDIIEIKPKKT